MDDLQTAAVLHLLDAPRDRDGVLFDPDTVASEVQVILAADGEDDDEESEPEEPSEEEDTAHPQKSLLTAIIKDTRPAGAEWESSPGTWWRMEDRDGKLRPIRISKPQGGTDAAGGRAPLHSPVHAEPVESTPVAQTARQDSARDDEHEQAHPSDKPDTATPTLRKPVPPSAGFTGHDTLGRKWQDGVHQEGEEEPLDKERHGWQVRDAIRKKKHLVERVNGLAAMGLDSGQLDKMKQEHLTAARMLEKSSSEIAHRLNSEQSPEAKTQLAREYTRLEQEVRAAYKRAYDSGNDYQQAVRKTVREMLSIPPEESIEVALEKGTRLSGDAGKHIKAGIEWVNAVTSNKNLVESFPPYLTMLTAGKSRASYQPATHTLLGSYKDEATAIHELAHGIEEKVPGVKGLAKTFRDHRAGDEKPSSYNKVIAKVYDESEKGVKDDFGLAFSEEQAWYVGKIYENVSNTEIVSMGVEKLYNDPVTFARKDPEYCCFILGVLDGTFRKRAKTE